MSSTERKPKQEAPKPSEATSDVPTLFTSLGALRENFDRFFENVSRGWPALGGPLGGPLRETGGPLAYAPFASFPRVDTAEDEKQYEISIELPGVDEKDITLSIEGGALSVKGEKKSEREEKKRDYHLTERSYGSFSRSFRLPENVDQERIEADFAKGVLRITLPKIAPSSPSGRTIEIRSR